jgi:hypothetical protein
MTRFRLLTLEELEALKPELIQFLASQGVTASDWRDWTENKNDKRDLYLEAFSDFIFFSVTEKTRYLIRKLSDGIQYVEVQEDGFNMIWFKKMAGPKIAGRDEQVFDKDEEVDYEIVKGYKKFKESKNTEIFSLLGEGFSPAKISEQEQIRHIFHEYV